MTGVPLSYPVVALEDGPIMARCFHCHLDPGPVCPQYAERPGPHSMYRQDTQTAVPVQGIAALAQVE